MTKKIIFILTLFLTKLVIANDVKINSVPTLIDADPVMKHVYIDFDLSWNNSWRNSTNYDAVWIFVKYKKNNGPWEHAYLDTDNSNYIIMNENGTGSDFEVGINNIAGNDRGIGVFVYRAANGTGNIDWENVHLKWNYGENNVNNEDSITIQVYVIEMVHVPEGSFWVGDGASFSRFHAGNNQSNPFQITNNPVTFGNTASNLWALGAWDSPTGTLNSLYPTGYNGFYCMKYSITQKQYVDFLNSLNRTQQNVRTATVLDASVTSVQNIYVMSASSSPLYRNGIRCNNILVIDEPIEFYCDLNNNGIKNENDDGQHIACNYLSWADGAAYAAWAGLRPMTETEYEKACRGDASAVAGEYAWGTTNITGATTINNSGMPNETANTGANCVFNNATGVQGPMRVGGFATGSSTREAAGATVYGIMEMSGNLWERTVSLGSAVGRSFTGINGDGSLSIQGIADVLNWPPANAIGSGLRGNHWKGTSINAKISARDNANYETSLRNEMFGFRAVRGQ